MINSIISTIVQLLIGWILIQYVPYWLKLKGGFAMIVKVVGVVVFIGALLVWV
jgi:hypothetical protein